MDPVALSAIVSEIVSMPEIAKVMAKWLSKSRGESVALKVIGSNGVEVANLTPANANSLLTQIQATPEGVRIEDVRAGVGVRITDAKIAGDIQIGSIRAGRDINITNLAEAPVTERPDPESLKISLVQETLSRMHDRLVVELPRARSRERLVKRVRLSGSLAALASNVGVLGALGLGNATASIVAAVIALLVSGLKIIEDHLIAGVTGKDPHRLQLMVIESTRLSYEAAEALNTFKRLNAVRASPKQYPLSDANRIAKELLHLLPEIELAQSS
jgi:hypothetical protein